MILWIIGLSGAGKTTLATEVVRLARREASNVAMLDGDVAREVWGDALGYSMADRQRNAERLCRLGKFLEGQNIHVVCAVLSLFEESRRWNRANLNDYYEVFVRAPLSTLIERDSKGLYTRALRGEISLPGINMDFPEPSSPDEKIDNNGDCEQLLAQAPRLASLLLTLRKKGESS